jgi:hypothetical protein
VYAEGTGHLAKLPESVAYAGVRLKFYPSVIYYFITFILTDQVSNLLLSFFFFSLSFLDQVSLLKSLPLRLYANMLAFNNIPFLTILDWTNVSVLVLFRTKICLSHFIFFFFPDIFF